MEVFLKTLKRERPISPINGLNYIDNFVSEEEEATLMEHIDASPWDTTLKRRTQHYGSKYSYTKGDVAQPAPPIPEWCNFLMDRLMEQDIIQVRPDQLIINEYQPGQGIGPHVDSVASFADGIVSISLGSNIMMDFKHKTSSESEQLYLKKRSMLALHKEARYDWRHSIAGKKNDHYGGPYPIVRKRRVSLTFRKIKT